MVGFYGIDPLRVEEWFYEAALEQIRVHHPDGLILVVDKGYRDRDTESWLNNNGITVVRPAYRNEPPRPGRGLLRAVRQNIESVNDTFKSQLDLEQHGGRTIADVAVRIMQRVLRHACATFLLASGASPRHSQISLAMNTYAHVLAEVERPAIDAAASRIFD